MTEAPIGRADGSRVRAVLFDLDDTLFDHRHCARTALESVRQAHDCFRCMPLAAVADAHGELLERLHHDVMIGRVDVDTARRERFRRLFLKAGVDAPADVVERTAALYRQAYVGARRSVAGAALLLRRVRERAPVVIVSNNVLAEQAAKLRHCELDGLIDALVVSAEEGVSKPDPAIFHAALARVACAPADAVMIGDSWQADIAGARRAGIRAIWLNPSGAPRPEAADDVAEIRALEPIEDVLGVIFDGPRAEAYADRR